MEIKVAVTWQNDILGKLLRKLGGRWSHVGLLYLRPGSEKWRVVEALMSGIHETSLEDFLSRADEYKFLMPRSYYSITNHEIVAYAWGNVGKRYGFGMLFRIAWEFLKRRFSIRALMYPSEVCSSLVYDCFKYVSTDLCPGSGGRYVTPDDIANSPSLDEE